MWHYEIKKFFVLIYLFKFGTFGIWGGGALCVRRSAEGQEVIYGQRPFLH